jgi:hypothetical protein
MRKIKDEADAVACLEAARRSRCETTEWAREHDVDARSLNAWKANMARRGTKRRPSSAPVALVELVPVARSQARYALDVGGVRFEFDDHFEVETLQRVVRALRAC